MNKFIFNIELKFIFNIEQAEQVGVVELLKGAGSLSKRIQKTEKIKTDSYFINLCPSSSILKLGFISCFLLL